MKKILVVFLALASGVGAALVPVPVTIDSQSRVAPGLETYQASPRAWRVSFKDGGAAANVTNLTPFFVWADTNRPAQGVVTSSYAVVGNTSNGVVDFTFTAADLNTNGAYIYEVGLAQGSTSYVSRRGAFNILYAAVPSGVGNVTYSWINLGTMATATWDQVNAAIAAGGGADKVSTNNPAFTMALTNVTGSGATFSRVGNAITITFSGGTATNALTTLTLYEGTSNAVSVTIPDGFLWINTNYPGYAYVTGVAGQGSNWASAAAAASGVAASNWTALVSGWASNFAASVGAQGTNWMQYLSGLTSNDAAARSTAASQQVAWAAGQGTDWVWVVYGYVGADIATASGQATNYADGVTNTARLRLQLTNIVVVGSNAYGWTQIDGAVVIHGETNVVSAGGDAPAGTLIMTNTGSAGMIAAWSANGNFPTGYWATAPAGGSAGPANPATNDYNFASYTLTNVGRIVRSDVQGRPDLLQTPTNSRGDELIVTGPVYGDIKIGPVRSGVATSISVSVSQHATYANTVSFKTGRYIDSVASDGPINKIATNTGFNCDQDVFFRCGATVSNVAVISGNSVNCKQAAAFITSNLRHEIASSRNCVQYASTVAGNMNALLSSGNGCLQFVTQNGNNGATVPNYANISTCVGVLQLIGSTKTTGGQTGLMQNAESAIGVGYCTVTNDECIVVGDGEFSHGVGSVSAPSFWGDGGNLSNRTEQLIQFAGNIGSPGTNIGTYVTNTIDLSVSPVYRARLTNSVTLNVTSYGKTTVQIPGRVELIHDGTANTYTCNWVNVWSSGGGRPSLANSTNSVDIFTLRWSGFGTNGTASTGFWMMDDHFSPMLPIAN